ncbi:hypothetical protein LguiA_029921 [Lonicera macranthoides]
MHHEGDAVRYDLFFWSKSQVLTLFQAANHAKKFTLGGAPTFQITLCGTKVETLGRSIRTSKKDLREKKPDLSPTQILLSGSFLERGVSPTKDNRFKNSSSSLPLRCLLKDKSHERTLNEFQLASDEIKEFLLQETLYNCGRELLRSTNPAKYLPNSISHFHLVLDIRDEEVQAITNSLPRVTI